MMSCSNTKMRVSHFYQLKQPLETSVESEEAGQTPPFGLLEELKGEELLSVVFKESMSYAFSSFF